MRHTISFWSTRIVFILFSLAVAVSLQGCGYGKIGPKAYEYAKALHSICDRKDEKRLEKLDTMLKKSQKKGEVTEKEARWLNEIVAKARQMQWEDATADARQMMQDQVKR